MELCDRVRALVAQANREAGETVLRKHSNAEGTELVIRLQDGHGFKLNFDSGRSLVTCEFPHCPGFNRTLVLSSTAEAPRGNAVWIDPMTGRQTGEDEIAGDLVRNLLIMTSDY